MKKTVARQIYFYQVAVMNGDFDDAAAKIGNLPREDIFYEPEEGKKIFCLLNLQENGTIQGSLHDWRGDDFPSVASTDDTVVRTLELGKKEGLVATTHFVYFPEKQIIGMEYNFNGPRIGTLARYFYEKVDNTGVKDPLIVDFTALYSRDAVRQINRMGDITSISIMVQKNHIDSLKNFDKTIFSSLKAAANFGELEEVELVLRPKKHGRKAILEGEERVSFLNRLRNFVKKDRPGDQFDRFDIKAWDSHAKKIESFDLLKDKMVYEVRTTKLNNARGVDPKDMFKNIAEAYKIKRKDLLILSGD